jgi:amidophosphoribosyltransferase
MRDCEGAYSVVALTKDAVFGMRDPLGLRPLCIGQMKEPDGSTSYHVASESCALGTIGSTYVREVAPGEIVMLDRTGIKGWMPLSNPPRNIFAPLPPKAPAFCVFEYVYFARPDSIMEGQLVHSVRTRLGAQLARESPVLDADVVSGVPDSSMAAALGYAMELKLPFSEVLCKNRYIGRTFIKPDDSLRKNAIQLKYNPLTHVLEGKKVVLVDDSLVRGNTLRQLVPLLRRGGAREVHIRISSPPIRSPCYMGVDLHADDLIAAHLGTVEAIRDYIGADSLDYLSYDGMMASVRAGIPHKDEAGKVGHCSACFTGEYPLEIDAAESGCC